MRGVLLIVGSVIFAGCSKSMVASAVFWDIDKDGNRVVDINEYHETRKDWLKEQADRDGVTTFKLAKEEFDILDTNGDGVLSKKEFFDEKKLEEAYKNRDKD